MRRYLLRSGVAALAGCGLLAACGDAIAPSRTETPPLRFVKPPLVVTTRGSGTVAWVRLNRPMRHSDGAPGEYAAFDAYLEIPGTTPDIAGLYRDDAHPNCYGQFLDGTLRDGEPVSVTLVIGDSERLTSTARAQLWESGADVDRRARKRLGCRLSPDAEHERQCQGTVNARHGLGISLGRAAFASCHTARQVMRSVGRWANSSRCYETLCVESHRTNLGFRCDVELVGEAAWAITCRDGRRVVRGYTAE